MNQSSFKLLLSGGLLFLVAWHIGCGKASSRGPVVSGVVHADRVSGASITIRELTNGSPGEIIARGTSFDDGSYNLPVDLLNDRDYLAIADGGTFIDEATGVSSPLGSPLRRLILRGTTMPPQPITPLSDLVTGRALHAAQALPKNTRNIALPELEKAAMREVATILGIENDPSLFNALPVPYASLGGHPTSSATRAAEAMAILSRMGQTLDIAPSGLSGELDKAFATTGRMDLPGWVAASAEACTWLGGASHCPRPAETSGGGHVAHIVLLVVTYGIAHLAENLSESDETGVDGGM